MKVFIVVAGWIHEGTEVIGVFSESSAAEDYAKIKKQQNKRDNWYMVIVKEFVVDALK